ncbi:hypothetical protein BC831DRAFT_481833 [Entophlyctis helioformis]|nr:hypothetical protein BC831DRAFT_481833 [Entophlyctis helioformis]
MESSLKPDGRVRRANSMVKFSAEAPEADSVAPSPRATEAAGLSVPPTDIYPRASVSSAVPLTIHVQDEDGWPARRVSVRTNSAMDHGMQQVLGSDNYRSKSRSSSSHEVQDHHKDSNHGNDISGVNDNAIFNKAVTISASGSLSSRFPFAREVSETVSTKLKEMRWVIIAITVNSLLMYYCAGMNDGIIVPLHYSIVTSVGCVVFELVLLISNILTCYALDSGASAWFGSLLGGQRGFSLSVCGFFQASPFEKWAFANQLSLNSTCRHMLSRASIVWVLLELMKWMTPIAATSIHGSSMRVDSGSVECIVFSQDGTPVDRKWPNVVVEAGVSELIFGTALGILRSEMPVNQTTFIMTPQIIGAVDDGDTIIGPGYLTTISTNCACTKNNQISGIEAAGIPTTVSAALHARFQTLGHELGWANAIDIQDDHITVRSLLSGAVLCGGRNGSFIPICTTTLSDHREATVMVRYMTDGTTASIAPETVTIRKVGKVANIRDWLGASVLAIFDGPISSFELPATVPGVLNPLMWWTSPNLMTINPALLEGGIETSLSILIRGGMQRTYTTHGETCARNIAVPGQSLVTMLQYGTHVSVFILSVQLFMCVVATVAFVPWLMSPYPLGPCIRAVRETVYFTTLVNSSSVCQGFDQLCNAQPHAIWQSLDIVVRIGEPIGTRSEPIGHISMDRPKLMGWLTNGKKYY